MQGPRGVSRGFQPRAERSAPLRSTGDSRTDLEPFTTEWWDERRKLVAHLTRHAKQLPPGAAERGRLAGMLAAYGGKSNELGYEECRRAYEGFRPEDYPDTRADSGKGSGEAVSEGSGSREEPEAVSDDSEFPFDDDIPF